MARTPSTMLPLNTEAPAFTLVDPRTDAFVSLSNVLGPRGTLVAFICNHCPYVIHVMDEIKRVSDYALGQGIGVVAINSNDVEN